MLEVINSLIAKMPEEAKALAQKQIAQNSGLSSSELEQKHCDEYNQRSGDLEGYDCSKCKNKGFIGYLPKDSNNMALRYCSCEQIRRDMKRIANSGLANLLDKKTFANYKAAVGWQAIMKQRAIDFANNPNGKWFFIGGQVGSGKTHLCTAIVGEMLKQGKSSKYMLWRDEVVKITSNVNDDVVYYSLINPLKTVDVLYIDDFFKIPQTANLPTQGELKVAFELINYRYNNELITIISSEHTADRIIDFEESVGSRIYEMTKGEAITIGTDKSKNYRLRGGINV